MTPDDYCANQVGGPGSTLYYSLMFLPPPKRRAGNAVYAFAREIADIVDECQDIGVAHTKFGWWREEILRLYAGAPRHPITHALAPVVSAHSLERESFLTLIGATGTTLGRVRFDNFELLRTHCYHTGAIPALLAATVFEWTDPSTVRYAETLGIALRLTEIVINLGRDVRRDRIYLPLKDLHRFGVRETDILAARHTAELKSLLTFQVERIVHYYDEALAQLSNKDRLNQLPGLIMATIARKQLDEIRRDGYHVLDHRLALTPLRKLWIAWSTRGREQRRRRRIA